MIRFMTRQRIMVVENGNPFLGKTGTIVRLRMADNGAWADMDDDLPGDLRSFPADDPHGRSNHTILYPDQCEAINAS